MIPSVLSALTAGKGGEPTFTSRVLAWAEMRISRATFIWAVLGVCLAAALGWAVYVSWAYLLFTRMFPVGAVDMPRGIGALLASLQGYAVAFGPLASVVVLSAAFHFVRRQRTGS